MWDLKMSPDEYLRRYGEDAPHSEEALQAVASQNPVPVSGELLVEYLNGPGKGRVAKVSAAQARALRAKGRVKVVG